ncbi:hypothetical protein [Ruegeria sp. EL01]|jgi:hypothetical protein|uniref:hypothetical protein n=1 Tax=Ruegeria sp. EL01 TaxID=2107578 RepID=UPI000EA82BC2|nr:hypothetical protein [Ruegeria sp. EL01]
MDMPKKDERVLLFNRFRFLAFFVLFQFVWASNESTTIFGLDTAFLFPVKFFVLPIVLATVLETSRVLKRYPERVSGSTLWYNAAYMVCLAVVFWWCIQALVLIYGMIHWGRLDVSEVLKKNGFLLIWAMISIGVCRYLLWLGTTLFRARNAQ